MVCFRLVLPHPQRAHDDGAHFADPTGDGWIPADIRRMLAARAPVLCRAFEFACAEAGIDHRLTKPNHPWTNGRVERMTRALTEATLRRRHAETHAKLRAHLATFLDGCNFARRRKVLKGRAIFEFVCEIWANEPHRSRRHPDRRIPGPNS